MTGPTPKTKPAPPPADLVGRVRRFGTQGVLYEVLEMVGADKVRIRVLDTSEELTYPLAKTLSDPRD
jgi:hypothetical protein